MTKHELETIIRSVLEEAIVKETREIKNLNEEVHELVEKTTKMMSELKAQNKELPSEVIAHMSIGKVLATVGLAILVPVTGVYMKLNQDVIEAKKDIQMCKDNKVDFHEYLDKIESNVKATNERINVNDKKIENLEVVTNSSLNSITNKVRNLEQEKKK